METFTNTYWNSLRKSGNKVKEILNFASKYCKIACSISQMLDSAEAGKK